MAESLANSAAAGDEGFVLGFTVHLSPIAAQPFALLCLLVEVLASCRRRLMRVRFSAGGLGFLTMAN
ncbi:hypothetical protein RHGRI_011273 [Rhododendron griersonianum]|uniref:Uncharacterized protein n=1 Tax=Rhododendron griersonianum TaxID=479676 RepID=A0AAV6KLE4_9ERIC|nr:hypothetical protein RHGRI_011273 [Rhododendron griersonianum]